MHPLVPCLISNAVYIPVYWVQENFWINFSVVSFKAWRITEEQWHYRSVGKRLCHKSSNDASSSVSLYTEMHLWQNRSFYSAVEIQSGWAAGLPKCFNWPIPNGLQKIIHVKPPQVSTTLRLFYSRFWPYLYLCLETPLLDISYKGQELLRLDTDLLIKSSKLLYQVH